MLLCAALVGTARRHRVQAAGAFREMFTRHLHPTIRPAGRLQALPNEGFLNFNGL